MILRAWERVQRYFFLGAWSSAEISNSKVCKATQLKSTFPKIEK